MDRAVPTAGLERWYWELGDVPRARMVAIFYISPLVNAQQLSRQDARTICTPGPGSLSIPDEEQLL